MKKLVIILVIMLIAATTGADCIDFAAALPGQTYVIQGDNDIKEMRLTFGQSQVSGFCPAGEALLEWRECIEENGREYCTTQELPLTYQTTDGNDWILLPNFAIGWLMNTNLYLIPRNTPMLELKSSSTAGPIPWGSW